MSDTVSRSPQTVPECSVCRMGMLVATKAEFAAGKHDDCSPQPVSSSEAQGKEPCLGCGSLDWRWRALEGAQPLPRTCSQCESRSTPPVSSSVPEFEALLRDLEKKSHHLGELYDRRFSLNPANDASIQRVEKEVAAARSALLSAYRRLESQTLTAEEKHIVLTCLEGRNFTFSAPDLRAKLTASGTPQ